MKTKTEIYAATRAFGRAVELRFIRRHPDDSDRIQIAAMEFDPTYFSSDGAVDPTTVLSIDEAQRLMDELWYAGLRPTAGEGTAGSLKATQYHLEDMRRIVFAGPPRIEVKRDMSQKEILVSKDLL